jgi:hypothetical protein
MNLLIHRYSHLRTGVTAHTVTRHVWRWGNVGRFSFVYVFFFSYSLMFVFLYLIWWFKMWCWLFRNYIVDAYLDFHTLKLCTAFVHYRPIWIYWFMMLVLVDTSWITFRYEYCELDLISKYIIYCTFISVIPDTRNIIIDALNTTNPLLAKNYSTRSLSEFNELVKDKNI